MKLLAIAGSVRKGSYNLALLRAIQSRCPEGSTVTLYNQIKNLPLFDPDIDEHHVPDSVCQLMAHIRESDGVIISTPEYAHGVPGALKNALDWLVASDAMILKPVVATSVSTSGLGGIRAHAPLLLILSAMNANVIVEGSINVPYAQNKFDDALNLRDELTLRAIDTLFLAMKQT